MKEQKSIRAKEFMNHYLKIYSGITILCVLMALLVGLTVLKLMPASPPIPPATETPAPSTSPTPETVPATATPQQTITSEPTDTKPDVSKLDTIVKSYNDSKVGSLVLVNQDHTFDPAPIVSQLVTIRENPDREFQVDGWGHKLVFEVFMAMNKFQLAMESELSNTQIQFLTTTPYNDSDLASEHATGLCADAKFYNINEGKGYSFQHAAMANHYKWVKENAWRFGFVFRYTSDKQSITGNTGEFYHLRYVGELHAEYMYKNNLCLEEYLELLKKYNFNSPLSFEANDGKTYYIYNVNASKEGDTTIYLRKDTETATYGSYTITGTNCDSFIVVQELVTKE